MADIVTVYMKHDDRASVRFKDIESNGYLPYVGVFGGDDTQLQIDNATGQIIGWVPIVVEDGKFVENS